MHIIVAKDEQSAGRIAATLIAAQVISKPDAVLGFATGSTPLPTYAELVRMHKEGALDFSRVTTFNLDEYVGLPTTHPESYYNFMWTNLFYKVNVRKEAVHLPDGNAKDLAKAAAEYDAQIAKAGGIDVQLLGIGMNGHIGFNEPEACFPENTHVVDLTESTIQANKRFFASEAEVPRQAVSMGIANIMHAKRIVLVACGANKADIVHDMIYGDIVPNVPASVLRLHRDVHIVLDEAAAKKIKK